MREALLSTITRVHDAAREQNTEIAHTVERARTNKTYVRRELPGIHFRCMGKLEDLYETVGGNGTIEIAVRAFYYRVLEDPKLRRFFQSTDMANLRSGQSMFVSMLLGGEARYTGKSLKDAHTTARTQGLTEEHFDAFLNHFRAALDEAGVKPDKAEKIITLLEAQRAAVLNG